MSPEQIESLIAYVHWLGSPFTLTRMLPCLDWLARALTTALGG